MRAKHDANKYTLVHILIIQIHLRLNETRDEDPCELYSLVYYNFRVNPSTSRERMGGDSI